MKRTAAALLLALGTAMAFAQASQPEDHSAHHPPGGTQPAALDKHAEQIRKMQDMHHRMQAARTPAQRQALLDEHTKLMQSCMELVSQMGGQTGSHDEHSQGQGGMMGKGGKMGMHGAMERRMAMMEHLVQMLVDREAALPRK